LTEPGRYDGGCVCGAIRFTSMSDPQRVTVCHCLWCQRRTGSAFGTEVVFFKQDIVQSGTVTAAHYRHFSDVSGRWLDMYFCATCGTNLGFELEAVPDIRTLPAGIFDQADWIDPARIPTRQVFARSRRNWGDVMQGVDVYEEHFR